MKLETLVHIKWSDSRIYLSPTERDDEYSVCEMQTVGFLIHEDEKMVVVARDVHDEQYCRGTIAIPKENIVFQEKLYSKDIHA